MGFSSIALHSWEAGHSLTYHSFLTGEFTASLFGPLLFCLVEGQTLQSSSYPLQCIQTRFALFCFGFALIAG